MVPISHTIQLMFPNYSGGVCHNHKTESTTTEKITFQVIIGRTAISYRESPSLYLCSFHLPVNNINNNKTGNYKANAVSMLSPTMDGLSVLPNYTTHIVIEPKLIA